MIDKKHSKMFFILLLLGIVLWLLQSLGGYLYAKHDLAGISNNYERFVKNTSNNPSSLNGKTIFFYRSSCKHCQSIIPSSYLIKSVMLFDSKDIQFYDVDKTNTDFVQDRLNVYKVPMALNFHKKGDDMIINEIRTINKDYILNALLIGIEDLLIIVMFIFILGWIIDVKYNLKQYLRVS
ncbi:hypothetical protein [Apilactobacillus timberlakei]|uniref:hypothetical protein n=1 Tax=Apilactobacillus timberlakei TaxID=2008380 RepID=UPI00112AAD46|nr:hypothetical protein [Apilactobacillus timberlakei]TPR16286.1 hypothetical protein DYZ95_07920 [Apilactobacillus timberlakei]TPR21543.1 hypothetical protein DY083_05850 [Apilactobacillus timberlakei]